MDGNRFLYRAKFTRPGLGDIDTSWPGSVTVRGDVRRLAPRRLIPLYFRFWTLAWCTFLEVQLLEDGTLSSLIPYISVSIVLFIGFTYICLDTAFSVSGYFDTTPDALHNNWIFTILIVLCGVFVLFSCAISVWVSGMFLRERRPLRKSIGVDYGFGSSKTDEPFFT
jgi:hypothetical protein